MNTANVPILDNDFNQKYQLLAKVGSGGMGDVFLGIQRGAVDFSRLVVVKRIHDQDVPTEYAEANAKMFLNEASVVASLNHPHIVKIFDFLMAGSSFCLIMEYVEGETLRHIFSECEKREMKFPAGMACSIIYDACNTLHYAHNSTSNTGKLRNIIHRDIGLHNLMLDSSGYLKIIDFGIAKSSIHTDMTSPGMIKGNPSYMAPELFSNKGQDHRLDIYALGLCLYELLTQTRAFQFSRTATVGEVIDEITNRNLTPPSSLVPDLPEGLDEVVLKAVAKDRDERYQTTEEFGQDLKRVANHIFMSGSETQKWFTANFATRLQERREFGAKLLETTNQSDPAMKKSLPSKLPVGFQIVSGITPSVTGSKPQSSLPSKTLIKTIAGGLLIAIAVAAAAVVLYSKVFGESSVKTEEIKVMDNLVVSSTPTGSRLSVNGKEMGVIGNESLTFHVEPNKKYQIVISKDGYQDFVFPFVGPSSGVKYINATLIKTKKTMADRNDSESPSNTVSDTDESTNSNISKQPPSKNDLESNTKKWKHRYKKGKKKIKQKQESSETETIKKRRIPLPDDDELMKALGGGK